MGSQRVFKDKSSKREFAYFSVEEVQEKHPDGNYVVVGEACSGEAEKQNLTRELVGSGTFKFSKNGTYAEKKYKTIGYIDCGNHEYVAIKKKSNKWLWWLFLVGLLLVIVGIGYSFLANNGLRLDPNASDYDSSLKRPENINDSQILIPGYGKFTVQKGSDTIDTVLFNPEGNPCFFQFTLVEKSNNRVLYESGLVEPGKGIEPVKMNTSFDEVGTYDAVLKFKTVDLEDTEITYNGSDIEVKLHVVE
ncbi:MAG: hypothetical protein ACK5KR_07665 [Breznakia sp.]